jgi:hypothetical protein
MQKLSHKKQIAVIIFGAVILLALIGIEGYISVFASGRCENYLGDSVLRCLNVALFENHQSLALMLSVFLVASSILYFLKETVFAAWKKFAFVYIPLVALAVYMAPEYSSDPFFAVTKEVVSLYSAGLFLLISLLIVFIKTVGKRSSK